MPSPKVHCSTRRLRLQISYEEVEIIEKERRGEERKAEANVDKEVVWERREGVEALSGLVAAWRVLLCQYDPIVIGYMKHHRMSAKETNKYNNGESGEYQIRTMVEELDLAAFGNGLLDHFLR